MGLRSMLRARAFGEEESTGETTADVADDSGPKLVLEEEPEYAFDGYRIEFNEKVALMPPSPAKKQG